MNVIAPDGASQAIHRGGLAVSCTPASRNAPRGRARRSAGVGSHRNLAMLHQKRDSTKLSLYGKVTGALCLFVR
jgi:hypothetical protein